MSPQNLCRIYMGNTLWDGEFTGFRWILRRGHRAVPFGNGTDPQTIRGASMWDLLYIMLTVAFFALATGLILGLDRL
ncbi:hypothetical protein SAMN05216414_104122 [Nitrosovibrio sp. Nv17]|nr:hypothetical protein SAMN05216414_104122 [Nitrosovibrio sp. Nv17]